MGIQGPVTVCYKLVSGIPILLDVYLPPLQATQRDVKEVLLPFIIYFHAGGLSVGNKKSYFPTWLHNRVISLGYGFISADYQLLPPATAHDIIKDIQDAFSFITGNLLEDQNTRIKGDPDRLVVAGSSAGGLCAYLAALHASPKPKALLSIYGMGGNFFSPHYLVPKKEVFFRGREILDPEEFTDFLYPYKGGTPTTIVDSPPAYHPPTYHIPGYPANRRMLLPRLYLQLGVFLDYYTGMHQPSISKVLREILDKGETEGNANGFKQAIPEIHQTVIPQIMVDGNWPATMLLHGTADTAVPIEESRHLRGLLDAAGVPVDFIEFNGKEHSFDYETDAEEVWKEQFDMVKAFLYKSLG
ncbi:hypothetical protein M413DRAFT_268696 [Hebeloma cylindrosporum]|uniref:Alpha/beta hydrolase fold-3 domain-containing protein n=1 Tax=Hebeloma cylindrosporum TaxID=76867 RepID=A0A0C2YB60_HEBCY|nr:hypothetical protein M413DRAFT_268696 [Hebeloma cylindrosporum h7]